MPSNTGLYNHRLNMKRDARKQAIIDDKNENIIVNNNVNNNINKKNNQTENEILSSLYRWFKKNL